MIPQLGAPGCWVARPRLLVEARLLSRLEHPDTCGIHDFIEGESFDVLVLEWVAGRSLRGEMREGMEQTRALEIGLQIAEALTAARAAGIVHRDLKPANAMLAPDGTVKVLDFGIARSVAGVGQRHVLGRPRPPGAPDRCPAL